jgi:hypothetical protein
LSRLSSVAVVGHLPHGFGVRLGEAVVHAVVKEITANEGKAKGIVAVLWEEATSACTFR